MSKHVDALILVGYSNWIVADVPDLSVNDTYEGMYYVRDARTHWYNGAPITEQDTSNLYAGEAFLSLGALAARAYGSDAKSRVKPGNPYEVTTVSKLRTLLPFQDTEVLQLPISTNIYDIETGESGFPIMFESAIEQQPSIKNELSEKWEAAQAVYAKRGNVAVEGYRIDALLDALHTVDIEKVAPDTAEFDQNNNVTSQSYAMDDIIDHTNLVTEMIEVAHYSTFDSMKNTVTLLHDALEDLSSVAKNISDK